MTFFITLLLIVVALAFIAYPYFSNATVIRSEKKVVASGNAKRTISRKTPGTTRNIDSEIEKRIESIRHKKQRFCPQCGAETKEDSRFCVQCGEKLPVSK